MKFLFIFSLFFLTSCATSKYPHSYFSDCEKKFSKFINLSSCAIKEIQKDCENKPNCRNGKNRFVDIMKRLATMVDKGEISDNEAMFRYLNLMDLEESKYYATRNLDFINYHYFPRDSYVRGIHSCYYSRTSFCY